MQVAVAVAAVAALAAVVDGDGVQWWRRGGAFNGGNSIQLRQLWGLRIGDDEATMEIDISGGGWRRQASAFDSGDGRRLALGFVGGDGWQLWQQWMIETAFNGGGGGGVRWRQQRSTAFNGVGDGLRREDERAAQGQTMQQPASTMRGREGGATRGRREMMVRQPAGATRQQEAARRDDKTTRGWRIERQHNNQPARQEDERAARGATRG